MSSITARTRLGRAPKFENAWRNEPTGTILSHVDIGDRDAYLAFDSPADARALAAECIKAAEAMEQIAAEDAGTAPTAAETE